MSEVQELSHLIDAIYQGASEPKAWPQVVHRIAQWLEAPKGLLFTPLVTPQDGGILMPHGISLATVEAWRSAKQSDDLWTYRALERGLIREGHVVRDQELATEAELRASSWYQEFFHKEDIARLMSGLVFGMNDQGLPLMGLSLYRSWPDPQFNDEEHTRFCLLLPHISRALGLMMTLRNAEMRVVCSHAALNQLSTGVALIGHDESIAFANQAAERIFHHDDGLTLRVSSAAQGKRRLMVDQAATRETINTAVRAALNRRIDIGHFNEKIPVTRRSGKAPYTLQISAFSDTDGTTAMPGAACAIAIIVDPERALRIDATSLAAAYGLTSAEARVATLLLESDDVNTLASRLQVQPTTVKTHLQRIYDKMGVRSRASLVRILLSHADP